MLATIETIIRHFKDEDGFVLGDILTPKDLRKLAESIAQALKP